MTCDAVLDLLSDHVDGRYPPEDPRRRDVEAHLAACPACAQALADYAVLSEALKPGPGRLPDPAGFERRLKARLDREAAAGTSPRLQPRWRLPAAAAALLAAAWAGLQLLAPAPPAPPPAPAPEASRPSPTVPPASWRLLGPATLAEAAQARDVAELVEDLRLVRSPGADPREIYREVSSLQDLAGGLQAVSYDP